MGTLKCPRTWRANNHTHTYTYRDLSSIMPQQTRNQNRSSTGCWGEVIVALAAVERPWSWGWIFSCKRGERGGGGGSVGGPGADCICRAGSDVDDDCGVCDMENPLSRSEFLLKNLHTLSSNPTHRTAPPAVSYKCGNKSWVRVQGGARGRGGWGCSAWI